jgi:predicted nucleic acid-binding protein
MIYLDSSVALARLFGEGRTPRVSIWAEALVSSRLLEYEVWNRIHARGAGAVLAGAVEALLEPLTFVELSRPVLTRALQPFPTQVRTLDALHLATIEFIRREGEAVELASYDNRLLTAAQMLGIVVAAL